MAGFILKLMCMAKVMALVKQMLTTEKKKLYYQNSGMEYQKAVSIIICNTSASAQLLYVVFGNDNDKNEKAGAVVYGITLAANETMSLPDRYLAKGNTIIAWSDLDDAISFSADIIANE